MKQTKKSDSEENREKRDIDLLFGSATRVDVLYIYLQNPDKWFGPREMSRLTRHSISDVQRNNLILYEIGLIESYIIGGTMAFTSVSEVARRISNKIDQEKESMNNTKLNAGHPWVPALRMLMERSIGSLKIVQSGLQALAGIDVAFVFGSYATSEQRPESDIDLVVIGKQTLETLSGPIRRIEDRIGREINPIAYGPDEWRSKFADRSYFIVSLMESPKIFLVGDASALNNITNGELDET